MRVCLQVGYHIYTCMWAENYAQAGASTARNVYYTLYGAVDNCGRPIQYVGRGGYSPDAVFSTTTDGLVRYFW
jgi:hypothetical protein